MWSNLKKAYTKKTKRGAADKPNKAEQAHLDHVAAFGCLVCLKPANIHHIMHMLGKRCRRDHRYVVPLCRKHHQETGGLHDLGGEEQFKEAYGIDLVQWAVDEWEKHNE